MLSRRIDYICIHFRGIVMVVTTIRLTEDLLVHRRDDVVRYLILDDRIVILRVGHGEEERGQRVVAITKSGGNNATTQTPPPQKNCVILNNILCTTQPLRLVNARHGIDNAATID